MATIVPTVDRIGDVALTNIIIDRSITELQDNIVTSLGSYAMANCAALKKVAFGSVSKVETYAFGYCKALEVADFHSTVEFSSTPFPECSALNTLILRSDTKSTLGSGTGLSGTGIAKGTGYIYVPSALVDEYKADTNWATNYADQIRAIEDYPDVCEPYSWEGVAKNIQNGNYKSVYKIGDTVPVDLGSEGIINMQIAAFDAEPLADGSGTAAISWVAKELLNTSRRINPDRVDNADGTYQEGTGGVGGWEKCELRSYLQDTVKALIPDDVASLIQSVSKTQNAIPSTGNAYSQTTADDIWIPSRDEVNGGAYGELFQNNESRVKTYSGTWGAAEGNWWLRDAQNATNMRYVGSDGSATNYINPSRSYFVCLGFCTGRKPQ